MARLTANTSGLLSASIWEASILATVPTPTSTATTISTTGIFTATFTAPNTTGKTTGVWLWFHATTAQNYIITLQEATVDTACTVTVPSTSLVLGWNYIRFPTPYQWTAITAGRYRFKIAAGTSNGGTIATASSLAHYMDTHDTVSTLASTDDAWVGGLIGATTTAVAIEVSGTSNTIGSGVDKTSTGSNTGLTGGAGLTIGNGGRVWSSGAAANTLQVRGHINVGNGGEWDRPAHTTDFTIITKTIMDCDTANGNYWFGVQGGAIADNTGAVSTTPMAEYVSGTGTSGSHFLVDRDTDWVVGMEILIEGNAYNQIEKKFIKAVYNVREFQLADTAGGAESALTHAHTATSTVAMITRNNVIEHTNSTRGGYFSNTNVTRANCNFNWARWSDMSFASGAGGFSLRPFGVSAYDGSSDYMVFAGGNSNRNGWTSFTAAIPGTDTGLVFYLSPSTNAGSGAVTLGSVSGSSVNQTFNDFLFFGSVSQTLILTNGYNNTFNRCRFIGSNSSNAAVGHAVASYNSGVNTFNDCRFNSSRQQAIYGNGTVRTTFNNCKFANLASNQIEVYTVSNTYNNILFNDGTFASATLVSNYLNQLEESEIKFQNMDGNTSKHRWYTNYGSWWSAGSGLTDTTVRTAGSLSLVSKPENNTLGSSWMFKIPVAPSSSVAVNGYVYRNATFSSGTLKVELFLPGTLLSATPDATYTFPTTTGSWLPFALTAPYAGLVARYAQVRITGVTSTAGAYFFVDDLYDSGTNNKVAGLDLWDDGKPSEIMVVTDFSSAVPVIALATAEQVWVNSDTYAAGTKGKIQNDANLTNVLVSDSLS